MMDEKLAKQIEQHKKRWKEHPEECPAEINSMSDEEVYEGIRNCTFLDTEIPGESREEFVRRLKKRKKQKKDEKIRRKEMRRQDAPDRNGPFWRAFLPM